MAGHRLSALSVYLLNKSVSTLALAHSPAPYPFPMSCHLRAVGSKHNVPFTEFTDYCWNADCPSPGNIVEFLQMTLQLMNCTFEVIQQDVGAEDSINMVANGSADISLLALRQTLDRMQKVDFTQPVNFLYYGYIIKEIPQIKVDDYILASFEFSALAMLIGMGLIVGALIFLYTKVFRYNEGSIFHWMVLCCQAFLNQFSCTLRGPIAAHVLVGFWLYFCILIVSNYQAKLKSFLTLSHARGTLFTELNGLLDIVAHKGYSIVLEEGGYSPYMYCNPEQCDQLRKIPKNKVIHVPQGSLESSIATHSKWIGFSAYTYDVNSYPISFVDVKKKLLFVRDTVAAPDFLAFAVNKDNPKLREQFNLAVLMTNPGYTNVRAQYTQEFPPYFGSSNVRQQVTVLRLSHVSILFQTCGEITAIAVFVFIAELLLWHFGYRTFSFFRVNCCPSFRHKLHITRSLSKKEFPRRQVVILPLRRSASPPSQTYQKFSLSPIHSLDQVESICDVD